MSYEIRYYRQGIRARQKRMGRWECPLKKDSTPYKAWMKGWAEEHDRQARDDECMARFTCTKSAIEEAQWLANQKGYAYAICGANMNEFIVKASFMAGIDTDEVLEIVHPVAKFSG